MALPTKTKNNYEKRDLSNFIIIFFFLVLQHKIRYEPDEASFPIAEKYAFLFLKFAILQKSGQQLIQAFIGSWIN
jgi:hypothetical protein